MEVKNITQTDFEAEVLQSDIPVLVDFWAPWCGPCKMLNPTIQQVADDFEGKVRVLKLNVDEAPQIASRYQVMSIPTLLVFSEGTVKHQMVGVVNKNKIAERLNSV